MIKLLCLIPFGMATYVGKFNFAAQALDVTIGFDNLYTQEFAQGVTMGTCLTLSLISAVIWLVILIYLWPLLISPDVDNPLRWYYPFTC